MKVKIAEKTVADTLRCPTAWTFEKNAYCGMGYIDVRQHYFSKLVRLLLYIPAVAHQRKDAANLDDQLKRDGTVSC